MLVMNSLSQASGEGHLKESQSIIARFEYSVKQRPGNLAIVCSHQAADLYGFVSEPRRKSESPDPPYLRWTYETLGRSVTQFGHNLVAKGAVAGTVLFAFCENQVESVICTLTAYMMGWIHVPIGPDYLCNPQEVQHMIATVATALEPPKVIVFVGNNEDICKVNRMEIDGNTIKICCDERRDSWESFQSLVGGLKDPPGESQETTIFSRELSVFFTSGTTSLPKACLVDTTCWLNTLESSLSLGSVAPGNLVNIAVPVHHAFGYICSMMPLLRGACVFFPGPKFSPQRMGSALCLESCTHAALVPTMVSALLQLAEDTELKLPHMTSVVLAGMAVNSSIARKCQDILGVPLVENFYGMTEGVFLSTGPFANLCTSMLNDTVTIGKPVPGALVRVCDAEGRSPVPLGVTGVLHFSGPTMIEQYLGCKSDDFYRSDNRTWFVTGDQAFMSHQKQLYIVGRHKDMIVCGGENIAPSKIEELLAQKSQFLALEPQVVAGDDSMAGEVPIVVTRVAASHDVEGLMRETIRSNLGARYVPRAWVSLSSLGLDDFPRTASGKIQKTNLRKIVANFLQSQRLADQNKLSHDVVTIWSRLLGLQVSHLDTSAPISQLADSILMLSARAKIKFETGLSVSLTEWLAIPTIDDQIKVFETLEAGGNYKKPEGLKESLRPGPPSFQDMVHLGEDECAFGTVKQIVEETIGEHGFSWEDVQDVFPCTDFIQILCRSQVINTWNIRTTVLSQNANVQV